MSEEKVKIEPKVPPPRLPSFKGLRDLSLGSTTAGKTLHGLTNSRDKPRKLFTPNVNVQRKRNQEVKVRNEFLKPNDRKSSRGTRGRGQGRGRGSSTLVQASGSVFAEGIAVSATPTRRAKYDTDKVKDEVLQIPKLNLKLNCKVDKEEEDKKLKELLRDDFLDDHDLAPDSTFAPVCLPLSSCFKKSDQNTKLNVDFKPKIKKEKEMIIDGVKIKQEVVEETESEMEAASSIKLEVDPTCVKKEPQLPEDNDSSFLLKSLAINEKEFVLIQFPDRLPALETSDEIERPSSSHVKSKVGNVAATQEANNEGKKYCRLSVLAPGQIGQLQIRKSGKIELVLEKCVLNVSSGTDVGFKQDLIAVQLHPGNQCTGETVELGRVVHRLICTPDWNSLLKSGGNM